MNILKPHVSLNISNIDASVAFYEKLFVVKADADVTQRTQANSGCCAPKVGAAVVPEHGLLRR